MSGAVRTHSAPAQSLSSILSFRQLEELWIAAGGARIEAPIMAAIALAESKGEVHATGHDDNGTEDRGPWQINTSWGSLSTYDVAGNAKAAVEIHAKQGLGAWTAYNNGEYKKYLTAKNLESGVKQNEVVESLAGLAGILEGKIPFVSGEGPAEEEGEKAEEAAASAFSWGSLTEFGVTAILMVIGAALVIYGIIVMVRPREGALEPPKVPEPPVPVPV